MKILAIKFKYIGDVAIWVPALRTLRKRFPEAELHILLGEESKAVLEHMPWIDKVWALPRKRGKAKFFATWPMLKALRRERFDLSIDFAGNDRGAILSLLIGAKVRVGSIAPLGFWGRKYCYNKPMQEVRQEGHESLRHVTFLEKLNLEAADNLEPELYSDPALEHYAKELVGESDIICHLSTSMPKKEWPIDRWVEFYQMNSKRQAQLVFIAGPSKREQKLLEKLHQQIPHARRIQYIPSVAHLMALLKEAGALICGDSSPAHLAAGLGTAVVALFGPTIVENWEPRGRSKVLWAGACDCLGHPHVCSHYPPCMSRILPESVHEALDQLLS